MHVLTAAMNAHPPALTLLLSHGFTLKTLGGDESVDTWIAESSKVRLAAADPLALLGLAALWQAHGRSWREVRGGAILYGRLLDGESVSQDAVEVRSAVGRDLVAEPVPQLASAGAVQFVAGDVESGEAGQVWGFGDRRGTVRADLARVQVQILQAGGVR